MWVLILLSIGIAGCATAVFGAEHVCPQEERYVVNVTRAVLRKVKIRNYKWCMSVPPRCSYYTDEEKYVPETVEQEEVRIVDKCCPGYQEDEKEEKCIPSCPTCIHGECEPNNKCNCHPGFWGENCSEECPARRWGRSCEFDCLCKQGDCDPVTGQCVCPPGWKGNRCDEEWTLITPTSTQNIEASTSTTQSTTEQDFLNATETGHLANLEQRLKNLSERTKYPIFQKYYTFYITTQNPLPTTRFPPDRLNEVENWRPPQVHSVTEKNPPDFSKGSAFPHSRLTSVAWLSSGNFERTTIYNHIGSSSKSAERSREDATSQPEVDTVLVPVAYMTTTLREDHKVKQEQEFVNNKITDQVASVRQASHANLKAKVLDGLQVSVTSTQPIFAKEEDWLNDESRVYPENEPPIHHNQTPINDSHLVFSVGAAAGVTATIILIVAVALLTTQSYRRKKPASIVAVATKSKGEDGDAGVKAVAIYARSVFHAPLPEPPVFENPVFTTPLEYENNSNGGTLEAHVICSMHLPSSHPSYRRDSRTVDAFYDHPPSTGSYRAASIPEPPELPLEVASNDLKEHLYDEIPCWKQPLPVMQPMNSLPNESLSYYANTGTSNKS